MAARDALVQSAIELIRRNGVAATGVAELLAHSGISRRSIYLNFPGGKAELIAEATRAAGAGMTDLIASVTGTSISSFTDAWKEVVESSGFRASCPIAAAALGRSEAPDAADAAAAAFRDWENVLSARLVAGNVAPDVAESLATTIVAAVEGAVLLSIATRSTEPLDRVGKHLDELIALHRRDA